MYNRFYIFAWRKSMERKRVLRYGVFFAGLLCNAFGVAFITKADLGTTPISSIPYTLSSIFPKFTLGDFTFFVSLVLIFLQACILKRKAKIFDILLQIPISFIFGYIIDLSMALLDGFHPERYPGRMASMLVGCIIVAFGAFFEVTADVTMLPADGLSTAIAKVTGAGFGNVKLITDSSQAIIALLAGLLVLHRFAGVREGTIIGALLIGNIVKVIGSLWQSVRSSAVRADQARAMIPGKSFGKK